MGQKNYQDLTSEMQEDLEQYPKIATRRELIREET